VVDARRTATAGDSGTRTEFHPVAGVGVVVVPYPYYYPYVAYPYPVYSPPVVVVVPPRLISQRPSSAGWSTPEEVRAVR